MQFPIHSTPALYAEDAPRRISTLPSATQKIIKLAQPFQLESRWTEASLAELQALSDIDKHRRLHIGQPFTHGTILHANVGGVKHRLANRHNAINVRLRRGLLLAIVPISEIERYGSIDSVIVDAGVRLTFAFDDSGIVTGRGVVDVLGRIGAFVELLFE